MTAGLGDQALVAAPLLVHVYVCVTVLPLPPNTYPFAQVVVIAFNVTPLNAPPDVVEPSENVTLGQLTGWQLDAV